MPRSSQIWLKSPLSCPIGTIWLAGQLQDRSTIPAEKMRVLGRSALVLVLQGRGYYADGNGMRTDLEPGDAILVSPQLAHAYGGLEGSEWGQAYAVFSGACFDQLQGSPVFRAHQPVWHLEPADMWRQRMRDILNPRSEADPVEVLSRIGRFWQLLVEMATTDAGARRNPGDSWLEESLPRLGEAQREGWKSPRQVAREVGLSYETFRKRFSERMGRPPGQYQQQRRIDQACAAIYRGAGNFKELAEELGFCDVYHFSKAFRKQMGMPPSAYRRSVRGG